jgi:potassium channel subfamily K, other eukaryote
MIVEITLLVYIAFGALVNTFLLSLNFIDALYFTVVTIETIGFGDITPDSTGSRVFTCFYMSFGILNVGMAVAMTRETVLEGLELGYRKRLRNLQLKRREARRFRHWEARWHRAVEWRLKKAGLPVWVPDSRFPKEEVHFLGLEGEKRGAGELHWVQKWLESIGLKKPTMTHPHKPHLKRHPRGKHLNLDALSPQELEAAALEAAVPLEMFLSPPREHQIEREASSASSASSTDELPKRDNNHQHHRRLFWYHRNPDTNGWPTHPQTPTHAQVGRMAAMVTKFAMAVTGTHVHMLGHAPETHPDRQREADAERDAQPNSNAVFYDEKRPQHGGGTKSSPDAQQKDAEPQDGEEGEREEGSSEVHSEKPKDRVADESKGSAGTGDKGQQGKGRLHAAGDLVVEGSLHPNVPRVAKDFAHGRNTLQSMQMTQLQEELEAEESKAYYAKVCYFRRLEVERGLMSIDS